MNKHLRKKLKGDVQDEKSAIKGYGARLKQAIGMPSLQQTLRHIKTDEGEHKTKLNRFVRLKRIK